MWLLANRQPGSRVVGVHRQVLSGLGEAGLPDQQIVSPFSFVTIRALAIDHDDNVVIGGSTPGGFPVTAGALQTASPAASLSTDVGFVAKLDGGASHFVFASYFGGTGIAGESNVASVAIDSAGSIWLTGESPSGTLPISPSPPLGPGNIAGLSPDGAAVSTFLGAPHGAIGRQIAVAGSGGIIVLGSRGSFLVSGAEGFPSIVGMSNFESGVISGLVSPVEILSLYGYNLGPVIPLTAQVSGGIVGSSLGGYQVLFDGLPAPLLSVGSNRIDCVVPKILVSCPGHNVISSDPSDNHETRSVCVAGDRRATKRVGEVGGIAHLAGG